MSQRHRAVVEKQSLVLIFFSERKIIFLAQFLKTRPSFQRRKSKQVVTKVKQLEIQPSKPATTPKSDLTVINETKHHPLCKARPAKTKFMKFRDKHAKKLFKAKKKQLAETKSIS